MKAKIKNIQKFKIEYLAILIAGFFLGIFTAHLSPNYEKDVIGQILNFDFREDLVVVFNDEIIERLNGAYEPDGPEYLFCLLGRVEENKIIVDGAAEQEYVYQGHDYILYQNDPPCQIEGSIGSIHSHPKNRGCVPSPDDLFTFGEMKDPEPIVNAIQCGYDEFYIYKMPGKQEPFNFNKLRWRVE